MALLLDWGSLTVDATRSILIEGNQLMGWDGGILTVGAGKTVSKNDASLNFIGVAMVGGPSTASGSVERNNCFGNDPQNNCGLANVGVAGLVATGNYWGAASGPGPDPADGVCNTGGGTTTVAPFATSRFKIIK